MARKPSSATNGWPVGGNPEGIGLGGLAQAFGQGNAGLPAEGRQLADVELFFGVPSGLLVSQMISPW